MMPPAPPRPVISGRIRHDACGISEKNVREPAAGTCAGQRRIFLLRADRLLLIRSLYYIRIFFQEKFFDHLYKRFTR
jgi:hypothetical protein